MKAILYIVSLLVTSTFGIKCRSGHLEGSI